MVNLSKLKNETLDLEKKKIFLEGKIKLKKMENHFIKRRNGQYFTILIMVICLYVLILERERIDNFIVGSKPYVEQTVGKGRNFTIEVLESVRNKIKKGNFIENFQDGVIMTK